VTELAVRLDLSLGFYCCLTALWYDKITLSLRWLAAAILLHWILQQTSCLQCKKQLGSGRESQNLS